MSSYDLRRFSPYEVNMAITLLRRCKEILWGGEGQSSGPHHEKFICHSIRRAEMLTSNGYLAMRVGSKLRVLIMQRLNHYGCLENWLEINYHISARGNMPKTQRTRQAWLDSLIAEFQDLANQQRHGPI